MCEFIFCKGLCVMWFCHFSCHFLQELEKWTQLSRSGDVAELVECLSSIWEILGSTPKLPKLAVMAHACHVRCGRTQWFKVFLGNKRQPGIYFLDLI